MIKSIFSFCGILACIITCSSAASATCTNNQDQKNKYVYADLGLPIYKHVTGIDGLKPGFSILGSLGFGYRVNNKFRAELELLASRFNLAGKLSSLSSQDSEVSYTSVIGFLNGLIALNTLGKFHPYLGAGIGLAHNRTSDITTGVNYLADTTNNLAFQALLGGEYKVNSSVGVRLDLRYIYFNKFINKDNAPFTHNPANNLTGVLHSIVISSGLVWKF